MNKIFRAPLSLLLTAVMLTAAPPAEAETYTVRDAYMHFASAEPEFILSVLENGGGAVGERDILRFMISLQQSLYRRNRVEPVTEKNFDELFIYWVKTLSNASEYSSLQTAIYRAYPEAADALLDGRIHPDIQPLFLEVRDLVLNRHMLDRMEGFDNLDFAMEAVEAPAPIAVEQLGTVELPAAVRVRSESGLWVKLPVIWDEPDAAYCGPAVAEGLVSAAGYRAGSFDGVVRAALNVRPVSASGVCGSRLRWSLENGTLTIAGSGSMSNYASADKAPWYGIRGAVNRIVVSEGVTSVGRCAFADMEKLSSRSVALPSTVTSVGAGAFAGTSLDSAALPAGLRSVGKGAFSPGTTLYGGQTGGPAYLYARREGLRYVPDNYSRPELVSLDAADGRVSVNSMNCPDVKLAFYSGGRLLAVTAADDSGLADVPAGARSVKAFCWDGLAPLCQERTLRLTA